MDIKIKRREHMKDAIWTVSSFKDGRELKSYMKKQIKRRADGIDAQDAIKNEGSKKLAARTERDGRF